MTEGGKPVEREISKHDYSRSEKCSICGSKDWMDGPCTPRAASTPEAAALSEDRLAEYQERIRFERWYAANRMGLYLHLDQRLRMAIEDTARAAWFQGQIPPSGEQDHIVHANVMVGKHSVPTAKEIKRGQAQHGLPATEAQSDAVIQSLRGLGLRQYANRMIERHNREVRAAYLLQEAREEECSSCTHDAGRSIRHPRSLCPTGSPAALPDEEEK